MLDWLQPLADFVNNTLGPPATFLEHYVWGWPSPVPLLAAALLGTGLYVTIRMGLIQIRGFRHAVNITRGKYDDPNDEGDLNHFQALTTALSATVGIGNIAGVAIAIRMGGPGALFWMWVTAFFGMALKFTECTLAVKYRKVNKDGSVSGGPMYYIEKGLGPNFKWMAMLFAGFAIISSFGGGCMNQSNTLTDQVRSQFGIPTVVTSLIFAVIVAGVIIGGIKRIGKVTSILAPGMALLYVVSALTILAINFASIPEGFRLIFTHAFAPEPLVGGGVGSLFITVMWGIRRGLFSNEAGQGSAPIAHATARTDRPVREGLVAALEPFIDTLVICTMTGLVIVTTGAYKERELQPIPFSVAEGVLASSVTDSQLMEMREARNSGPASTAIQVIDGKLASATLVMLDGVVESEFLKDSSGNAWNGTLTIAQDGTLSVASGDEPMIEGAALLNGAPLTAAGFRHGLGAFGNFIVTLGVVLFAVSTGISWSYYGDRATEYLFGSKAIPIYRWVFIFFFFMGGILPLQAVWVFGDVALGLMTFPNLIAVILLSGVVAGMTRKYMSEEHKAYK